MPVIAGVFVASSAFGATVRFDNGAGTNTWENPVNWNTVLPGPDGIAGTGDDVNSDGLPGATDVASISPGVFSTGTTGSPLVVSLSSTQTVSEAEVSNPAGSASNVSGTATLNVLPGALLTVGGGSNSSTGLRIGRTLVTGQTPQSQQGSVIQTGGTVLSRVRLSPESLSADSLYAISGGNLVGASAVATQASGGAAAAADLIVGVTTSTFNRAEFHVIGSAATNIRFVDTQVADSTVVGNAGRSVFHFSLDAGGVTPIVCEDEFQFRNPVAGAGAGLLQVDLVGVAPQADVTLVIADRLGNNGGTGATGEHFTNFLDGDTLVASGAGYAYTYTVDYTDGSDNFNPADNSGLEASIILRYVSRVAVPEPTSIATLALGGMIFGRRRRA